MVAEGRESQDRASGFVFLPIVLSQRQAELLGSRDLHIVFVLWELIDGCEDSEGLAIEESWRAERIIQALSTGYSQAVT